MTLRNERTDAVLTLTLYLHDDLRIFKHFYFIIIIIKFLEHEQFKKSMSE